MSIFITGDIHGNPGRLSTGNFPEQKEMTKDDVVIICGDFGLCWDYSGESKLEKYLLDWLNDLSFTTIFVDGNHENFVRLYGYPVKEWNGGKVHELRPSVLHLMRGEVFNIQGFKFFAFGGASSHDVDDGIIDAPDWRKVAKEWDKQGKRFFRVKNISWWEQELPTQEEMQNGLENLRKNDFKVDFVLSHCAPSFVQTLISAGEYETDILTDYLQDLISEYNLEFSAWVMGHYHANKNIMNKFFILYEQITQIV